MTSEFLKTKLGKFKKERYSFSPGQIVKGRYRISKVLTWGGVSEIYLAEGPAKKTFIVKTPWKERAHEFLLHDIFENEEIALKKSKHGGVVELVEYGTLDHIPFLVLEYLGNRLVMHEHFSSIHSLIDCFSDVCDTLSFIHAQNIVHRDVKADNIFLQYDQKTTRDKTKMIDFQYAKIPECEDLALIISRPIGSPEYMPPEQTYLYADVDHRADIYALALNLYVLTARVYTRFKGGDMYPFVFKRGLTMEEHIEDCFEKQRNAQPMPLHQRIDRVPQRLSEIILKALNKKPEKRQQSAEEFKTDLQDFKAQLPLPI